MFWAQFICVPTVVLCAPLASAESGKPPEKAQYISDDISVTIRQKPANDAEPIGAIRSGARVTVLESLGSDSFAHIRTADGRDGWITARFISEQPAARDQLNQQQQLLEQAKAQTQSPQRELEAAQQQLAKARPALEMAGENDKLRAAMAQREQQVSALERQYDEENARRKTLLTGAIVLGVGIFLGLALPWMGGRKKRRSDF